MVDLIVPRKKINFVEESGLYIPFSGNTAPCGFEQPLIRAKDGIVEGLESGYRSGIVDRYRIKGCRPDTRRSVNGEPWGTQTLSLARYEAERIQEIGERFRKDGIKYPVTPVGFWQYDRIYKGEPVAATIYNIEPCGDTRLDELLWWLQKDIPPMETVRFESLFETTGMHVGRLLKTFHNYKYSWDWDYHPTNAHSGNILVYADGKDEINFCIVDLGCSISFDGRESNIMKRFQKYDLFNFLGHLEDPYVGSQNRVNLTEIAQREFSRVGNFINSVNLRLTEARFFEGVTNFLSTQETEEYANRLRNKLLDGFLKCYKNPDIDIPSIHLSEITGAKELATDLGNKFRTTIRVLKRLGEKQLAGDRKRVEEEEKLRKRRHWRTIDDGYGFADESRITVMVFNWSPERIHVYENGTLFSLNRYPEYWRPNPEIQGFGVRPIASFHGARVMSPEEILFHLGVFKDAIQWWDSDKENEENGLRPSKEELIDLYRELFAFGIVKLPYGARVKINLTRTAERALS